MNSAFMKSLFWILYVYVYTYSNQNLYSQYWYGNLAVEASLKSSSAAGHTGRQPVKARVT